MSFLFIQNYTICFLFFTFGNQAINIKIRVLRGCNFHKHYIFHETSETF